MEKNPLLKYVMKAKKEDVVHSSAYGKAQSGGGIGVASTQSFAKRMEIEKKRNLVRGYGDAGVVGQARAASGVRAKKYEPQNDIKKDPPRWGRNSSGARER